MALQFSSTDSVVWAPKYGNGAAGTKTLPGGTYDPATATFSGGAGGNTGTIGSTNTPFAVGDCCFIIAHQYNNAGAWQLNFITDISGTNITFLYPLQTNFGGTAQIVSMPQYRDVYMTSDNYVNGWDGSKGGVFAIMASSVIQVDGNINMIARGYRGGIPGPEQQAGGRGESYAADNAQRATNQYAGGGGGGRASRGFDAGHAGGGGGHSTSGQQGTGHNDGSDGEGGTTYGQANLQNMFFGAGGGGNGMDTGLVPISGSAGGGIIFLLAPRIVINGGVYANGGDASNAGYANGGAGAGGSILMKCNTLTAANAYVNGGLRTQNAGGWGAYGGFGGMGRIHVDYATSASVTNTGGVDYAQDATTLKAPVRATLGGSL